MTHFWEIRATLAALGPNCNTTFYLIDPWRKLIVDKKLLDILVCPVTKGPLIYDKHNNELISLSARLAYPIRDDIPVMLEDEARTLTEEEVEQHRG